MEEYPFDPPLPTDALMRVLGGSTHFIHLTNQSPVEMCACSVLAASALTCQGLVDVRWKDHGKSPTNLYFFVEAESGERKSSNDDIAFSEIRKFDAEQGALARAAEDVYEMHFALWALKLKQIRNTIAKKFAKGQCTADAESQLAGLKSQEPQKRKFAQLLLLNLTPQALARHLGSVYPYAGLITDEGAAVFSGGALGDLGMLNKLWEAGIWSSDRITRERIELLVARLTIYIQVQPSIMDDFLERRGKQFHGSGFSSRGLYAHPKSRQGERLQQYIDIPAEAIEVYQERIRELLSRSAGPLPPEPAILELSPAASDLLKWFSREIEKELKNGGRFSLMRGAASKITENCVRLAATLHMMEGLNGPITVEVLRNAIKLSAWFLNQYRMRFCPRSQLELDMIELEDNITEKIAPRFAKQTSVPGTYICRYGPRRLRQVDRLWEVLKALESRGKVKVWGDRGTPWSVQLTDWIPRAPVQVPRGNDTMAQSFRFLRFDKQPDQPVPPVLEVKIDGYELWPGVFLE